MKKLITILLVFAMSLSLLAGCGGSDSASNKDNTNTNTNSDVENNQQEEERGEVTVSYNVTDYATGDTLTCELTYDSSLISKEEEIFDDVEPTTDISGIPARFYHSEGGDYEITFLPGYYSAASYYENEKEYYADNDTYKEVIFSDLTKETIGSIELDTYTQKLVWWDDDTLDYQFWLIQFEEGILFVKTFGDEEYLPIADAALKDLLVNVTINGKEPGTMENVYTLYDFYTGEALYTVTYNPNLFTSAEESNEEYGETILNYADTSREYTQMVIHVNEYPSGETCFESTRYYSGGINYYVGDDGNYLETAGEIGDATIYIGLGLQRNGGGSGYVFFAEMPDGNVITGNIPGSYVGDSLDIYGAFLSIQPVE